MGWQNTSDILDGDIIVSFADDGTFTDPVGSGVVSGNTISVEAIYGDECTEVVYTRSGS